MTEGGLNWITEAHSQTLIEAALEVSEDRSSQLLSDAKESGLVKTKHPLDGLAKDSLDTMESRPGGMTSVDWEYDPHLGRSATRYLLDDVRRLIQSIAAPDKTMSETKPLVSKPSTKAEVEHVWEQYVATFEPPAKPTKEERREWGRQNGLNARRVEGLSADQDLTPEHWRLGGRPKG